MVNKKPFKVHDPYPAKSIYGISMKYCKDIGQTATMAIERILDDYLTKYMADKENASEGENKAITAK